MDHNGHIIFVGDENMWTWHNDKQSVHVGINHRIGLCRQQKEVPKRILLGREHTRIFMKEMGWNILPRKFLYNNKILVEFNATIYGIAIESDKPP